MIRNIKINDSKLRTRFLSRRALQWAVITLSTMAWATLSGATMCQAQGTQSVVVTIAIDPSTPDTLYVGTAGQGVFKSTNGGNSWTPANSGLDGDANSIAIHPNGSTLYAATLTFNTASGIPAPGAVYKTTNGGTSWTLSGLGGQYVTSVKIDPTAPNTVYASAYEIAALGAPGGAYRTLTGGAISWLPINGGLTTQQVVTLAMDPNDSSILYAGTDGGGVFKWSASTATWSPMNTGLINLSIFSLAVSKSNSSVIYAGTGGLVSMTGSGIFKSADGGANWAAVNNGIPSDALVASVAIDPTTSNTVYIGTQYGLYKSTDGGASWATSMNGISPAYVTAIAINPTTPSTIYAGTFGGGVFKSIDSGANWTSTSQTVKKRRAQTISQ